MDLLFGDSGSGKTTMLERLAKYINDTTGKITRVYSGGGGEDSFNQRGLVDDGIIELCVYDQYPFPLTVTKLIADRYFLKDPKDKTSKLVAPDAKLFDRVGLIVYEGGAVMGQYMLGEQEGGMSWHAANKTGFGGVKDNDGQLNYSDELDFKNGFAEGKDLDKYVEQGSNAPKHWQIIQKKLLTVVRMSKRFPGMVIWTSHPTEGPDRTSGGESKDFGKIVGKKIIGPDFGGKALASVISREFTNTLHADTVDKIAQEQDEVDTTNKKKIKVLDREFRLYTVPHFDPNEQIQTQFVALNRFGPDMDDYFKNENGDGLLKFYQKAAELQRKLKGEKTNG